MRKQLSLVLVLLLIGLMILQAGATSDLPLVIDNADLLTDSEESALEQKAAYLQQQYNTDIVILTVDSLNGKSAQNYADDYFDDHHYGECGSGILFLLAMSEREWYISTYGDMIYAVTDYGVQDLGENAVWYFGEGYYYDGFDGYLDNLTRYLQAYQNGSPITGNADYSGDYYHGDRETTVYYDSSSPNILISLLIGILVAAVVILIMRSSMNTMRKQSHASSYLQSGSFHLKTRHDLFLYSNVTKTRKPQNTGSGGGGSSVHHSSSGRSHGGGGGRF